MTSVCVFGCKNTTRHLIEHLIELTRIDGLVTISPMKGDEQNVAGYDDMEDLAENIPNFYVAEKYNLSGDKDSGFFEIQKFDIGLVAGWQRLVPSPILNSFRIGVFGMHGSSQNLPFGRGRSPMNWSLIEGREWFYTNLFKYVSGADDGPIVDTICFSVNAADTAETLHFKNLLSMVSLVRRNWQDLSNNTLTLKPQSKTTPTYYPKRTPNDGIIDWEDVLRNVERHIRAVSAPFAGAFSFLGQNRVTIERATIFYTDLEQHPYLSSSYGTICDVFPNGKFLVRCNGGVLMVHEYRLDSSLKILRNMQFISPPESIKRFERNTIGNFDPCLSA